MIPRSLRLHIAAIEDGDPEREAEALRALDPRLEVVISRQNEVQRRGIETEPPREEKLVLEPLVSFVPYMRVRWRYSGWPADEWKEYEFGRQAR